MRIHKKFLVVAAVFVAITLRLQPSAQSDTFGSDANAFAIDFVNIGNSGNAPDPLTGYGAVPYEYRISAYEISQDAINKATASGMANVTAGAWTGNQPAANISWYEAAAFVNWLNTSTGKQAAYDLGWTGSAWSMNLWSTAQAWQVGGENLYRNKAAFYFLPSEDEWYKAAYFNQAGSDYSLYPTGSDIAPTPVASGTNPGTAVYGQTFAQGPAGVDISGGLSPFATMGQGGNVWELMETAFDGNNDSSSEERAGRGGLFDFSELGLRSSYREFHDPDVVSTTIGFRVASVPEPSTYVLLLMTGAATLWSLRRR